MRRSALQKGNGSNKCVNNRQETPVVPHEMLYEQSQPWPWDVLVHKHSVGQVTAEEMILYMKRNPESPIDKNY